ncbi:MAG: beta-phosphoglucomutase [Bacillus sp. (in: firmicutes)]
MVIQAVIFDLDGVIVTTDEFHYNAWSRLCEEEGIQFTREINNRLRGVSRQESLRIILEKSEKIYTEEEIVELANRKNGYYRESLQNLTEKGILPGVSLTLDKLKKRKIKLAIGSSSKNAPKILKQIGLDSYFDAVVDGNDIKYSKPDPEVFLLAAQKLGVDSKNCLIVEDAEAGVTAAIAGNMKVAAIGEACKCKKAHYNLQNIEELLSIC